MYAQTRRNLFLTGGAVLAASGTVFGIPRRSRAEDATKPNDTGPGGLMLRGYDPVAYFADGKPEKGDPAITAVRDGLTWQFASEAHRDAFLADPAKYQPAYGGYCAFGTSQGHKAPGDPEAWTVVDGQLYLNYNKNVRTKWREDVPGFVKEADQNWPKLKDVPPG